MLGKTPAPLQRILITGSCFSAQLCQTVTMPHDFVLFNGGVLAT